MEGSQDIWRRVRMEMDSGASCQGFILNLIAVVRLPRARAIQHRLVLWGTALPAVAPPRHVQSSNVTFDLDQNQALP